MITHVKEEHESAKEGKKYVGEVQPDFNASVNPTLAEFIFRASKVLTQFREEWLEEHQGDDWATGLEIDLAPVHTDGFVMGFMALSEVDGKTYDYVPTKNETLLEEVDTSEG